MNECKWFECENMDREGVCMEIGERCNYIGLCPIHIESLCETCWFADTCCVYDEDGDSDD